MRICMLLRNPFTRDARVLREARSLAAAGHDVTVVALRTGDLPEHEERDGFRIWRAVAAGALSGPTISSAGGARAPARRLPRPSAAVWARDEILSRRMARAAASVQADAFHAHDLNTLEAAAQAARRQRARLVYDAHELYPDLTGLARGERARWLRLERRLIKTADAVIVPSHARADEMARRHGIERPLVVMNVPPAGAPPDPARSVVARHRREGDLLAVYAGGFTPNRGLENVVRAAARTERCTLVMIGWGPLASELRAAAGTETVFLDPVEPDDVVQAVSGADVGVAPYVPVGLNNALAAPNKLFEYLHAGLAVAGSDLPDIRRVVDEHEVGAVFDATDPDSIARALVDVRARLDVCKRNARAAAPLYTWEAQERELLELYERLR